MLLGSALSAACVVEGEAESFDERRDVVLVGEQAQLIIDSAVERVPMGEVTVEYVRLADGTVAEQNSQEFQMELEDGTTAAVKITCNHGGCTDVCSTGGCLPNAAGTGCSGAYCGPTDHNACKSQNPSCGHSATAVLGPIHVGPAN